MSPALRSLLPPAFGLTLLVLPFSSIRAQDASATGGAALIGTGLVFLGSMVYDVATAPGSARKTNLELSITPRVDPANGSIGVGFSFPLGSLQQSERRRPETALAYSMVGSLVPLAMVAALPAVDQDARIWMGVVAGAGLVVGPGAGHWYAGQPGRGNRGVLIRFLSLLIGFGAATMVFVD